MFQLTSVYKIHNKYIIHPLSQTLDGDWIASEPITVIEKKDSELIGLTILNALKKSKTGVKNSSFDLEVFEPILKAARIENWETFNRVSQNIVIQKNYNGIFLVPYRNLGPEHGYQPMEEKRILLQDKKYKTVGKELLKAFSLCE